MTLKVDNKTELLYNCRYHFVLSQKNSAMSNEKLKLVKDDPWLEPSAQDIKDRYDRFNTKLNTIETDFGGLSKMANAYRYFGINYDEKRKGWTYREWAPAANALYLTGDFNNWAETSYPLEMNDFGIWEIFIDEASHKSTFKHGSKIKVIVDSDSGRAYRIPAYITRVIQDEDTKNFSGQLWFSESYNWNENNFSNNIEEYFIYECHVGMAQELEGVGTYREFAEQILPRIKSGGYNAIQMMAIQEHPYYGSFGYHVSSFFAPSSRFGTPEDLKFLINKAHQMGIAVILDIVHSHTVKNTIEGINQFDGSDGQYFHSGSRGEHPQWDSKIFDYGKTEVLRFLLSNVKYWMEEFHFDGFRFDGVGSMMYYHHGIETIDSQEKYFRQGVEWDAITYLQLANELIHGLKPKSISIAEDVTGMPGLTSPVKDGGIGFDFRLGMGIPDFWIKILKEAKDEEWNMHEIWDVLNNRLPHVKTIAYAESHDQALVGDKTLAFRLMDKEMYWHMHKDDPNLIVDRGMQLHKMLRLFTVSLGGQAYMTFMGNEFGHPEWIDFPREGNDWNYKHCRRQWSLVDDPLLKYQYLDLFDKEMIRVIKDNKIMSSLFGNQLNIDEENKTVVFERNHLIFIFNFSPNNSIPDYKFSIPIPGEYKIIFNSDDKRFGGHGRINNIVPYISRHEGASNMLSIYNTNRTALVLKRVV